MVYLDNAATTPISARSKAITQGLFYEFGNPSSIHPLGVEARQTIDESRQMIADLLRTEAKNIIFTSGGSESNALAIKGVAKMLKRKGLTHCITTKIEHSSVLGCFDQLEDEGFEVTRLSVGTGNPNALIQKVKESIKSNTGLISMIHTNNETGMILPVRQIGKICKASGILFHVDAVQAFGKEEIILDEKELDYLPCDLMSVSGHKLHAPKGIGFLYSRVDELEPLIPGHQESGKRGGTENAALIRALSIEARSAYANLTVNTALSYNRSDQLFDAMEKHFPYEYHINTSEWCNSPNIFSITVPGLDAETAIMYLATKYIYVSAGSACRSKEQEPSYVLKDYGLTDDQCRETLRVSTSAFTSSVEISTFVNALRAAYELVNNLL